MPVRLTLLCLAGLFAGAYAQAVDLARLPVAPFALLPDNVRHPESLATDPASGEVYAGTFDAREPAAARDNQLLRFDADGRLLAQRRFGATPLTGIVRRLAAIRLSGLPAPAWSEQLKPLLDAAAPSHVASARPLHVPGNHFRPPITA